MCLLYYFQMLRLPPLLFPVLLMNKNTHSLYRRWEALFVGQPLDLSLASPANLIFSEYSLQNTPLGFSMHGKRTTTFRLIILLNFTTTRIIAKLAPQNFILRVLLLHFWNCSGEEIVFDIFGEPVPVEFTLC